MTIPICLIRETPLLSYRKHSRAFQPNCLFLQSDFFAVFDFSVSEKEELTGSIPSVRLRVLELFRNRPGSIFRTLKHFIKSCQFGLAFLLGSVV